MVARIYRPARNVMQSGLANTERWFLEFVPEQEPVYEPLMGWTSSGNTQAQVRMVFATKDEAVAFALKEGIAFEVKEDEPRRMQKKSYADNFRWGSKENWTH
jgi:hypothetical protein